MAEQYKDPWADAANQAVGALYKYYLSKPNAADVEAANLKNRLLDAQYGTEIAQQKKYGLEADGLEMRNNAPSKISEILTSFLNQNGQPAAPAQSGVSNDLMGALVNQESGGDPMALSPKGAGGLTQIMPDTARDPGFGVKPLQGWDGKDPRTAPPEEQLRFGRDYLGAMKEKHGGDERLALAAYNAGPGAVEQYGGIPPFQETQNYVESIGSRVPLQTGGQVRTMEDVLGDAMMEQPPVQPAAPAQNTAALFNQFLPQILQQSMSAAIENPAQAADVLQMVAGTMNLPPELMANIQAGAGVDYANTRHGVENQPYTLSPGSVRFGPDNQEIASAPFKTGGGSYIQQPDGTIISIDGGMPTNISPTKSVVGNLQEQQIASGKMKGLLKYTKELAGKDPLNFGLPGFVKGRLQDVTSLLSGITTALGYEQPELAFQEAQKEILQSGLDPSLFSGLFDPSLPALETAADLLVYQAASALAGQSGRDLSDKDITNMKKLLGDPTNLFTNQEKFLSKLAVIEDVLGMSDKVVDQTLGGNVVTKTGLPNNTITPEAIDQMSEEELDKFLGIQ